MLFNSHVFLFLFLPVVLVVFFRLGRTSQAWAAGWLAVASVAFYGYWSLSYVGLLLGSVAGNFTLGAWIAKAEARHHPLRSRQLLFFGVAANLSLLGYYKYSNFIISILHDASGGAPAPLDIILPLGISFFTFTQIAFLVDASRGLVKEYNFVHYLLFVTYFPHLIAGPVLHHKEMMPQFAKPSIYRFSYENMAVGSTIFFIGLFKKTMIADVLAPFVGPIFSAPVAGVHLTTLEAWGGALCYSLQLYFDFSGYSDMAIGLSRMIGVVLPLNFSSPYKATSIVEFWRRWHMTLSRFLLQYLYIPLGGNRKGRLRRLLNIMATMLLGGLWHGANYTFVLWGGLHGAYLVANHLWRALCKASGRSSSAPAPAPLRMLSTLVTFTAVVVAWVLFRAESVDSALAIYRAMAGVDGLLLPDVWLPKLRALGPLLISLGVSFGSDNGLMLGRQLYLIGLGLALAWFAPNTQEIMSRTRPALDAPTDIREGRLRWRPTWHFALVIWLLGMASIVRMGTASEFLYFQF